MIIKLPFSAAHPEAQQSLFAACDKRIQQNSIFAERIGTIVALNQALVCRNVLLLEANRLIMQCHELKTEIRAIAFEIASFDSDDRLAIEALERQRAALEEDVEFLNAEIESIRASSSLPYSNASGNLPTIRTVSTLTCTTRL